MNNADVENILNDCQSELDHIDSLITSLGKTSAIVPYLNKYAIMKACGSVETAYKTIIADYCNSRSKKQVKTYINNKLRVNSRNPSYSEICKTLGEFDNAWKDGFTSNINGQSNKSQIITSIDSLVSARNQFAHGGDPSLTIQDVRTYFSHSRIALDLLDNMIKK